MPDKKIDNIHDKAFKSWMNEKSEAIAFARHALPKELAEKLLLDDMEIENASFVDEVYEENHSDIIYSCPTKKGENVLVSFIFEHKSYLPKYPEFQLMRYLYNGYNYQLKQDKEPTAIICILLYHGKELWLKRKVSDYFRESDAVIERYTPNFDYVLVDLADYTDQEILSIERKFLMRSMLLLFKHKNDDAFVIENSKELFIFVDEDILPEQVEYFFSTIFTYILHGYTLEDADVVDIVEELNSNDLKNKVMSTYDMLVEKGRIKGLENGLERGMQFGIQVGDLSQVLNTLLLAPDWAIEKVALFSKTTPQFVKLVKAGFEKGNEAKARKTVQKIFKEFGELNIKEQQKLEVVFQEYLMKFKK